jgi:hypothetical protein
MGGWPIDLCLAPPTPSWCDAVHLSAEPLGRCTFGAWALWPGDSRALTKWTLVGCDGIVRGQANGYGSLELIGIGVGSCRVSFEMFGLKREVTVTVQSCRSNCESRLSPLSRHSASRATSPFLKQLAIGEP